MKALKSMSGHENAATAAAISNQSNTGTTRTSSICPDVCDPEGRDGADFLNGKSRNERTIAISRKLMRYTCG